MSDTNDNEYDFSLDKSVETLTNFAKTLPYLFPVKVIEDKAYDMGIVTDSEYCCKSFKDFISHPNDCVEEYKFTYEKKLDLTLVDDSKIIFLFHFDTACIGVIPALGTKYSGEHRIQLWGRTIIPNKELFK